MSREPWTPLVGWLVFGLAWVTLVLVLASNLAGCAGCPAGGCGVDNVSPDGGASAARADCLDDGGAYVTITEGAFSHSHCTSGTVRIEAP
jgi:hypothetical protein